MSKGLGKVQRAILEYVKTKVDAIPPKHTRLTGKGWVFAADAIYHAYEIHDGEIYSNAQYKAGMRAVDKLAHDGLIEKVNSTGTYFGMKRGRLAHDELERPESNMLGLTRCIFIRVISVD